MDDAVSLCRFLQPIAEAPFQPGEPYGPCLFTPGRAGRDWALGEWDGRRCIDWDHGDLTPTHFRFLGSSPSTST